MDDITRRHESLPSLPAGMDSYGELATWHLRRIIADLLATAHSPLPLDVPQLIGRTVFALTCIEAHDPTIPRYDIGPDMPMAGPSGGTDPTPPSE